MLYMLVRKRKLASAIGGRGLLAGLIAISRQRAEASRYLVMSSVWTQRQVAVDRTYLFFRSHSCCTCLFAKESLPRLLDGRGQMIIGVLLLLPVVELVVLEGRGAQAGPPRALRERRWPRLC